MGKKKNTTTKRAIDGSKREKEFLFIRVMKSDQQTEKKKKTMLEREWGNWKGWGEMTVSVFSPG